MKVNVCIKNKCIKCCEDTMMILTDDDIKKIQSLGFKKDFFVLHKEGWLKLKNHKGRCVFHDGSKCTIYNSRPIGCKLYPVIFDKDTSYAILDNDCPYKYDFNISNTNIIRLFNAVEKLEYEKSKRKKY